MLYDTNRPNHRGPPPPPPPPPPPQGPPLLPSPRLPSQQHLQHQHLHRGVAWEPAPQNSRDHALHLIQRGTDSPDGSNLCRRCMKVLTQPQDVDLLDASENIESVTQAAAAALTQLAQTLNSGISSEQRLACMVSLTSNTPRLCIVIPSKLGSFY
jgi:hypothetical protein